MLLGKWSRTPRLCFYWGKYFLFLFVNRGWSGSCDCSISNYVSYFICHHRADVHSLFSLCYLVYVLFRTCNIYFKWTLAGSPHWHLASRFTGCPLFPTTIPCKINFIYKTQKVYFNECEFLDWTKYGFEEFENFRSFACLLKYFRRNGCSY